MNKIKDLTMDDLEHIIEQKILEILGDPDLGLELKEDFKSKLKERLENPSPETLDSLMEELFAANTKEEAQAIIERSVAKALQ